MSKPMTIDDMRSRGAEFRRISDLWLNASNVDEHKRAEFVAIAMDAEAQLAIKFMGVIDDDSRMLAIAREYRDIADLWSRASDRWRAAGNAKTEADRGVLVTVAISATAQAHAEVLDDVSRLRMARKSG